MANYGFKLALMLPLLLCLSQSADSATIEDRLAWPTVCERTYGTPKVVVKEANLPRLKITFLRPARLITVKTASDSSDAEVNHALRSYFLCRLWEDFLAPEALTELENRLEMRELIPMSRETFFKIGHCQLSGRSTGNPVHDAWWKVRTGGKLEESCNHLLSINNLEWDDPTKKSHGHYAFAIRKRGGHTTKDVVYDFRAPWNVARRPRFTEAPNIHNVLKLKGLRENLYDWLHTQNEFRNSHVTMTFVKVHEEQLTLLRAYNGHVHEAGNFRVFKKNCASLGRQFINRLLPFDEKLKGDAAIADLPAKVAKITVEKLGGAVEEVQIKNRTLEVGNEPTSKSEIRPAEPSRGTSHSFILLKKISVIN